MLIPCSFLLHSWQIKRSFWRITAWGRASPHEHRPPAARRTAIAFRVYAADGSRCFSFFIVLGHLHVLPQSTSITWERTASRRRPVFSSHLFSTVLCSDGVMLSAI